eukprot:569189-Pelagomonas_calceolata.AAC.3
MRGRGGMLQQETLLPGAWERKTGTENDAYRGNFLCIDQGKGGAAGWMRSGACMYASVVLVWQ